MDERGWPWGPDSGRRSLPGAFASQPDEVRIHRQADPLALLGVELAGHQVVAPDRGRERVGIVGLGGDVVGVVGARRGRSGRSRPRDPGQAREQRRTAGGCAACSSPCAGPSGRGAARTGRPGRGTRPRPSMLAVLVAGFEEELQPRQTPRHGLPARTASRNASPRPVRRSSAIASANAPTPGRMTFDARRTCSGSHVTSADGRRPRSPSARSGGSPSRNQ